MRRLVEAGLVPPSHVVEAERRLASGLRELSVLALEARAALEETAMRDALDARRGQVQAQSRVAQAQADVPAARQEFERLRQRFDVGVASRGELADAEARLKAAERALGSAAAGLEHLRYKDPDSDRNVCCHSLNNTVAASPRILIPLIEMHQQADGSIAIPAPLRPHMGGRERIG